MTIEAAGARAHTWWRRWSKGRRSRSEPTVAPPAVPMPRTPARPLPEVRRLVRRVELEGEFFRDVM